jgi:thioredoxin-related protein
MPSLAGASRSIFPPRKRLVGILFAVGAFVFSGTALAALFSVEGKDISSELQAAKREGRRLAIFFELADCPECLKMKRHVFSNHRVEKQFGRYYRTARIDLASPDNIVDAQGKQTHPQGIAQQLQIFGAPSFAFFSRDGTLEYRHTGSLTTPSDFIRLGRFVANAVYEKQPFSVYRHPSIQH